jgi:hypothetical protein
MDEIVKVLYAPKKKDEKWELYKVQMQGINGNTYNAYLTPEEYRLIVIKAKLLGTVLTEKLIEEFEEAVKDVVERNQRDNN